MADYKHLAEQGVQDTNLDGRIDMPDYHVWMENAGNEPTSYDPHMSIGDEIGNLLKLFLGILIVFRVITWFM